MTTHQIELPDTAQSFVEEQVAAGQFTSVSEFVVRLIEQARQDSARQRVEALLLEGLESGPGEEATPEYWERKAREWSHKYQRADKP
jgi:antitoxin ParD1/3/4